MMNSVLVAFGIVTIFSSASQVLAMASVTIYDVTDTLTPENQKYADALEKAADAFREAEALFKDEAFVAKRGWKQEEENDEGDVVYGKMTPRGKMVTVATVLEGHVDFVMKETWDGVAGLPDWNPNINYAKTIATLTDHTDVIMYGNNDVLIVSGRDFVSARLFRALPDKAGYIMASKSVSVDDYPEQKGKVRGELHLAAVRFRPDPSAPETKTLCEVIGLVDLKGMLPKIVINQMLPKLMLIDTAENKKHFHELAEKAAAAK